MGVLVFHPPRNGPTIWEIGVPDRTEAEFYVPEPNPTLMNQLQEKSQLRCYFVCACLSMKSGFLDSGGRGGKMSVDQRRNKNADDKSGDKDVDPKFDANTSSSDVPNHADGPITVFLDKNGSVPMSYANKLNPLLWTKISFGKVDDNVPQDAYYNKTGQAAIDLILGKRHEELRNVESPLRLIQATLKLFRVLQRKRTESG
ncbi:Carbohydrate-binding-like fold [Artemisia annua]|uniref:Carbohydrate-binding-like fold n=1 Tax=Artemisia annua TaxID=35608 RepID=A0A2U1L5T8_ARTAN|nr:Carbohydrate-binding-like fold [Artemisia annua]